MVALGYHVSTSAYRALGHEGTYYGLELGTCKIAWITTWPYGSWGYLPPLFHPMFTAQMFALLGLYKSGAFREAQPLLVPLHIVNYWVCIA